MSFLTIASILIVIGSFFMSIFLIKNNKGRESVLVWGIFCLFCTFWGIGGYIFSIAKSENLAYIGWQVSYVGAVFLPVLYYHFAISFLNIKNKKFLFFLYCLGLFFLFLVFFHKKLFFGELRFVFNEFYCFYWNENKSPFFLLFYIGFHWLLLIYSCFLLFLNFLKSTGTKKNQLKYFLIGSMGGFLGGHLFFLVAFGINLYPYADILIAIYPLIIGYGIVKYRLMDINLAITRTGIFLAVYSLVLGIPFAMAFVWQQKLCTIFGQNWWIVPLITSTLLATVGPFVYIFIDRKAEARLFREQKDYQNILRNASKGMIRIKDLKRLLNLIVHVVSKAVKVKNIAIYLYDNENAQYILQAERGLKIDLDLVRTIDSSSSLITYFNSKNDSIVTEEVIMKMREDERDIDLKELVLQLNILNAALTVPCFLEDKLIGILILGEKRSKKLYSEDDLAVFSVLANQAALAIENAQFYDEIQKTNEQLIQAEKLATIGTMADGLSHQINNRFHALSLISGDSLDILQTFDFSECSEKVKEVINDIRVALEKIQNNVLQGGEVVKGLLKYSRPEDGGFEPVSLIEVVNGAIEMLQYKIKLKEIRLVQNIPIGLSKLIGSRIQLQEVFFNLIDNAFDAIKERQMVLKEYGYKGKIEISAVCLDSHVEIIIADNGIGVKEHDRKKLFAPFFTTKASSRKGTGLGLYVIEKIVTAHQGKLSVDSNYGVGTHFVMLLPTSKG